MKVQNGWVNVPHANNGIHLLKKSSPKMIDWANRVGKNFPIKKEIKTISIHEVISGEEKRIITPDTELNRVLGGGIVCGSLILVAGEPGIGKSTLFLQIGLMLRNVTTLYVSGEESEQQIRMRADRLKIRNSPLMTGTDNFFLLTETSTQAIFQEIKN